MGIPKIGDRLWALVVAAVAALGDAKGQTSIWAEPYLGREGEEAAAVVVVINPVATPVTVLYRTHSGTATAGADFVAITGTVRFEAGEQRQTVLIPLLNDALIEGEERFEFELYGATGGTVPTPRASVTIYDNDIGHHLAGGPILWSCPEEGPCAFRIERGPDFGETSVEMYLAPVTAAPGVDYVDEVQVIRFAAGQTSADVSIRLLNNRIEDDPREVVARLRNGVGAPATGQRRIRIRDNETGYERATDATGYAAANEDGTFTLVRNGDYDVASVATVMLAQGQNEYDVADWATFGADFTGEAVEARFAPFQTQATVRLPIISDAKWEPAEGVLIRFTASLRDSTLRQSLIYIEDNEVNPLPVQRLCFPERLALRHLAPTFGGKLLVGLADGDDSLLIRLAEDGSQDNTFSPQLVRGRISNFAILANDEALVVADEAASSTLFKVRSDGSLDESFAGFTTQKITAVELAPGGGVYVAVLQPQSRVYRLNSDGTADGRFVPVDFQPEEASVTRLSADDIGGLFLSGHFDKVYGIHSPGAARISETGGIDWMFAPGAGAYHDVVFDRGEIFSVSFEGGLKRLLATGEVDGNFPPITRARSFLRDAEGRFYSLYRKEVWHHELTVERWNRDGTRDDSYPPGKIAIEQPPQELGLTGRNGLIVSTSDNSVNAANLRCDNLMASEYHGIVSLTPPGVNIEIDARTSSLHEGASTEIGVFRTGANHDGSLRVRYEVRDGTARYGTDYSMERSGLLEFAAGVSRLILPVNIMENATSLMDAKFYLDFMDEEGEPIATREIQIVENDVSIRVARTMANGGWEAVVVGPIGYIPVYESTDLISWTLRTTATPFSPFRIQPEGSAKFFQARRPE